VIIVLGRPRVHRPDPSGELLPGGLAAEIALALGRGGVGVELVGSIGDDPEGDRVVVGLGQAGVGHAALLRDPAARTPSRGATAVGRPLPRLDAADVELGLRYLPACRVLVVADTLAPSAMAGALGAAAYHGAAVVVVAPAGSIDPDTLGDDVTLFEAPVADELDAATDEPAASADEFAFAQFVADYAARLDRGEVPAAAFAAALGDSDWEPSAG
jgi:sugar/nucleoside kinase (ribokinase family)